MACSSGPSARALRATSPAATSTDGFEVLVQLVIAAIDDVAIAEVESLALDRDARVVVLVVGVLELVR